jgi:hypothetical protein
MRPYKKEEEKAEEDKTWKDKLWESERVQSIVGPFEEWPSPFP